MRFLSTQIHGILDYLVGIVLIAAPWVLGFDGTGVAHWLPVVVGAVIIIYSLLTRYELSVTKVISMPVHLGLDALSGLVLAASPWIFNFSDEVWLPHLVFGLVAIVAALVTKTHSSYEEREATPSYR